MSKNEIVKRPENTRLELVVDPDEEPLNYAEVLQQLGIGGQPIPTKELVDKTFTIYRAKTFSSSFQEGAHAWFCVVKPVDSPEPYSVVIGGEACVEVLDAYAKSGTNKPLKVTLRYAEGQGSYNGYYFFE